MVAGQGQLAHVHFAEACRKGVDLGVFVVRREFFAAQPGLVGRAGAHAVQLFGQEREDPEHGKAFQSQKNPAAGLRTHVGQDVGVGADQPLVHHVSRSAFQGVRIKADGFAAMERQLGARRDGVGHADSLGSRWDRVNDGPMLLL